MADDTTTPSGGSPDSSGSGTTEESVETLKANRDKILSEKKQWQAKAKEFETKLAEFDAKFKEVETKELEAKGDLKKLLDIEREKAAALAQQVKDANDNLAKLSESEKDRKKLASVLQAFDGGLDKRWWNLIDIDQVVIDPDTGEVDKGSVDKVTKTLKETYPEMVRKPVAGMPKNATQSGGGATIGHEAWKALPSKEKAKWGNDQIIVPK